jgi:hypothetical protein
MPGTHKKNLLNLDRTLTTTPIIVQNVVAIIGWFKYFFDALKSTSVSESLTRTLLNVNSIKVLHFLILSDISCSIIKVPYADENVETKFQNKI